MGSRSCSHGEDCLSPRQLGETDSTETSKRYLTSEEYKQLLREADRLHVRIIPEFDMPGHARAAILSMRQRKEVTQTCLMSISIVHNGNSANSLSHLLVNSLLIISDVARYTSYIRRIRITIPIMRRLPLHHYCPWHYTINDLRHNTLICLIITLLFIWLQRCNIEGCSEDLNLEDPDDVSEYESVQMFKDNAINPCQESTYTLDNGNRHISYIMVFKLLHYISVN